LKKYRIVACCAYARHPNQQKYPTQERVGPTEDAFEPELLLDLEDVGLLMDGEVTSGIRGLFLGQASLCSIKRVDLMPDLVRFRALMRLLRGILSTG
jgi:hypothetical protein